MQWQEVFRYDGVWRYATLWLHPMKKCHMMSGESTSVSIEYSHTHTHSLRRSERKCSLFCNQRAFVAQHTFQIVGVNLSNTTGLNPIEGIQGSLAATNSVTLRFMAHSYPSVVAVLPATESRDHQQRINEAISTVSAVLKRRSIPLSFVPISSA